MFTAGLYLSAIVLLSISFLRGRKKTRSGTEEGMEVFRKHHAPVPVDYAHYREIEEYIGRANTDTAAVSIARMRSPSGWEEPGQTPEFDEYTVALRGTLRVRSRTETIDVRAGQAVIGHRGEWI